MKAQIYYQDFRLNALRFNKKLAFDMNRAIPICTIEEKWVDKETARESIYYLMNHLDIPPEHPQRPVFEKAGHTSMSVGDFIIFDDEPNILHICKGSGWQVEQLIIWGK